MKGIPYLFVALSSVFARPAPTDNRELRFAVGELTAPDARPGHDVAVRSEHLLVFISMRARG